MTDEEMAYEYARYEDNGGVSVNDDKFKAFLAGLKAGRPKWHKLDWEKDYPELDRLVRVRTKSGEEYNCITYDYHPTEDEIGYGNILTQFEKLNGDWIDDNEIEYWCYLYRVF